MNWVQLKGISHSGLVHRAVPIQAELSRGAGAFQLWSLWSTRGSFVWCSCSTMPPGLVLEFPVADLGQRVEVKDLTEKLYEDIVNKIGRVRCSWGAGGTTEVAKKGQSSVRTPGSKRLFVDSRFGLVWQTRGPQWTGKWYNKSDHTGCTHWNVQWYYKIMGWTVWNCVWIP